MVNSQASTGSEHTDPPQMACAARTRYIGSLYIRVDQTADVCPILMTCLQRQNCTTKTATHFLNDKLRMLPTLEPYFLSLKSFGTEESSMVTRGSSGREASTYLLDILIQEAPSIIVSYSAAHHLQSISWIAQAIPSAATVSHPA